MRTKTGLLCLVSLLALPAYAGQAVPDEGTVAAVYNCTFYNEPTWVSNGNVFCFTFTTTGGYPDFEGAYARSGTFTSSDGSWTGSWYQNGDEVMLASSIGSSEAVSMIGKLDGPSNTKMSGRYLDMDSSNDFIDAGTY